MSQRKIYIFNIGIEEKLDISSNVYSHISNKKLEKAVSSMEQMCLLHANIDDVVIFENVVPIEVLESIRKIKDLPTILYCKRGYLLGNDKIIIGLRNLAKVSELCLYPYAITEEINKFAEKLGCNSCEEIDLYFSDWTSESNYGECIVWKTEFFLNNEKDIYDGKIFSTEYSFNKLEKEITSLKLPENENIHIFAITLSN